MKSSQSKASSLQQKSSTDQPGVQSASGRSEAIHQLQTFVGDRPDEHELSDSGGQDGRIVHAHSYQQLGLHTGAMYALQHSRGNQSPYRDNKQEDRSNADSVHRMNQFGGLQGEPSETEGWPNEERHSSRHLTQHNHCNDRVNEERFANGDSGDDQGDDGDNSYLAHYSIHATEIKNNLVGSRLGLPFKVGLPLSNNEMHLNPRDAVTSSPTISRHSAAAIPRNTHHQYSLQQPSSNGPNALIPLYPQYPAMGSALTISPQPAFYHQGIRGTAGLKSGQHHSFHPHMGHNFDSHPQLGMLPNYEQFFLEKDNAVEKLNLSEYSHTPTSLKMTSPFLDRSKLSNNNTAGGVKDITYSRYDNLKLGDANELSHQLRTPKQNPQTVQLQSQSMVKKNFSQEAKSEQAMVNGGSESRQNPESNDLLQLQSRVDTLLAPTQHEQKAFVGLETPSPAINRSTYHKQQRLPPRESPAPVSAEKNGTASEQNARNLSADHRRDQALLASDSALPLINERSGGFIQRVETMGTPQTKNRLGTAGREDTQTERGLLQSGVKTSKETTNTQRGGSTEDRQTNEALKMDRQKAESQQDPANRARPTQTGGATGQLQLARGRNQVSSNDQPQMKKPERKDESNEFLQRIGIQGGMGPRQQSSSLDLESVDFQLTQTNRQKSSIACQQNLQSDFPPHQERGSRQNWRVSHAGRASDHTLQSHAGQVAESGESRQSGRQLKSSGNSQAQNQTSANQQTVYHGQHQKRHSQNQNNQKQRSHANTMEQQSLTSNGNAIPRPDIQPDHPYRSPKHHAHHKGYSHPQMHHRSGHYYPEQMYYSQGYHPVQHPHPDSHFFQLHARPHFYQLPMTPSFNTRPQSGHHPVMDYTGAPMGHFPSGPLPHPAMHHLPPYGYPPDMMQAYYMGAPAPIQPPINAHHFPQSLRSQAKEQHSRTKHQRFEDPHHLSQYYPPSGHGPYPYPPPQGHHQMASLHHPAVMASHHNPLNHHGHFPMVPPHGMYGHPLTMMPPEMHPVGNSECGDPYCQGCDDQQSYSAEHEPHQPSSGCSDSKANDLQSVSSDKAQQHYRVPVPSTPGRQKGTHPPVREADLRANRKGHDQATLPGSASHNFYQGHPLQHHQAAHFLPSRTHNQNQSSGNKFCGVESQDEDSSRSLASAAIKGIKGAYTTSEHGSFQHACHNEMPGQGQATLSRRDQKNTDKFTARMNRTLQQQVALQGQHLSSSAEHSHFKHQPREAQHSGREIDNGPLQRMIHPSLSPAHRSCAEVLTSNRKDEGSMIAPLEQGRESGKKLKTQKWLLSNPAKEQGPSRTPIQQVEASLMFGKRKSPQKLKEKPKQELPLMDSDFRETPRSLFGTQTKFEQQIKHCQNTKVQEYVQNADQEHMLHEEATIEDVDSERHEELEAQADAHNNMQSRASVGASLIPNISGKTVSQQQQVPPHENSLQQSADNSAAMIRLQENPTALLTSTSQCSSNSKFQLPIAGEEAQEEVKINIQNKNHDAFVLQSSELPASQQHSSPSTSPIKQCSKNSLNQRRQKMTYLETSGSPGPDQI